MIRVLSDGLLEDHLRLSLEVISTSFKDDLVRPLPIRTCVQKTRRSSSRKTPFHWLTTQSSAGQASGRLGRLAS